MREELLSEAVGHVTGAAVQWQDLAEELLVKARAGNLPLSIPRETWRYYFAGQALAGLMASRVNGEPVEKYSDRAKRAADALLEELEKEPREGGETP